MPAYRLPQKTVPASSSRRGVAGSTRDDSSPLAAAIAQHLRAGNMEHVARLSASAARSARDEGENPRKACLLLLAAATGARAVGDLSSATDYLASADAKLPPRSGDLMAQVRREQIRLLLDQGQHRAALSLLDEVDSTVIERVREAPIIKRDEADITPETLLLQAEVLLGAGALEEAGKSLEAAQRRLEGSGVPVGASSCAEALLASDCLNYLRLLEAVLTCRAGDVTRGRAMLFNAAEWLEFAPTRNQVLIARCQAASGEWVDVDSIPPPGINIFEARRWQQLARPANPSTALAVDVAVPPPSAAVTLPPSSPLFLPAELLDAYAARYSQQLAGTVETVTTQFSEQLLRLVGLLTANAQAATGNGSLYGGKFPHIDLASVIAQAELQRETGYILVNWNTALVETTIMARRLSPLARCGVGYVWLREGSIIDATLCAADPPPSEAADERSAMGALTCLLQLGIGIGLDHAPDGQALCYSDERARTRAARIRVPPGQNPSQSLMHALVVARETELGIGPAGGDIIGEWEK